jgi:hypothetical protein
MPRAAGAHELVGVLGGAVVPGVDDERVGCLIGARKRVDGAFGGPTAGGVVVEAEDDFADAAIFEGFEGARGDAYAA